jgi:hypothetical protein
MEWYWLLLIILATIGLTVLACAVWFAWSFKDFMG